jgi:predicted DNA-binding transcriptional regulator AlpA
MEDNINTARIAEILGVSREHVTDRVTKRPDFPKPKINRSRKMRYWSEREVLRWAAGEKQPA